MKILVLGSTGMLGHAVAAELETSFEVVRFVRENFDAMISSVENIPQHEWVINCIGSIKQNSPSKSELVKLNSVFPKELANYCKKRGSKLVHISTDCVFSGKKGGYVESDIPDADDDYGVSKADGEAENCMVIRTSLVGRETRGKKSLLEWCLSQKGSINGFTNHFWNGLTTYEFSKALKKIIEQNLYSEGIRHLFSNKVSKFEMLKAFVEHYELSLSVKEHEDFVSVDRTLNTNFDLNRDLQIPTFEEMIKFLPRPK